MKDIDFLAINKDTWDKRTDIHLSSQFYDVEGFKQGACSLNPVELGLLGDVNGKRLLHLQCHFGQDTLSLARKGAVVTGVDLSSNAISQAETLAQEMTLEATFIQSDVTHFKPDAELQFDLVYTSYGVLCWLKDLDAWANTVANALKPNGVFTLVEFHPFLDVVAGYGYFPSAQPDVESEGTYTENCDGQASTVVTWPHPISEVVSSLLKAGLVIEQFEEHPYSPYDCFDELQFEPGQGYYKPISAGKESSPLTPMLYSIQARKPAAQNT